MTRADLIALMAVLVAFAAAMSTSFQWRRDKRDERIKNAIDFSKYFYERTDEATKTAVMKGFASQPVSTAEMKLLAAILDQLEYLALLTNKGKLDQGFLSPDVQCLMVFALGAYGNLKKSLPQTAGIEFPELNKFAPHANCPSKEFFDATAASLRRT